MSGFAPPVQRLITELSKLPGVGTRTAQRLAFHILKATPEEAGALAEAIREVKERIGLCEVCFNLADEPRCRICQDPRRDHGLICVVEEPGDVIPIERTHEYAGVYHVLGGALSPIDGVDAEDLKIDQLYARVAAAAAGGSVGNGGSPAAGGPEMGGAVSAGMPGGDGSANRAAQPPGSEPVREILLATNPTTTGEATALHIAQGIRELAPGIAITRLASGLPVGSDLEYADEITLGKALAGRRAI